MNNRFGVWDARRQFAVSQVIWISSLATPVGNLHHLPGVRRWGRPRPELQTYL